MALRIDPRLAWQVVEGEAIVVDLSEGRMMGLNPAGSLLWSRLAAHGEDGLAEALTARFDVDLETARRDATEFLHLLRERRLVTDAP